MAAAHDRIDDEFFVAAAAHRMGMAKTKDWKQFIESRRYKRAKKTGKVISKGQATVLSVLLGGKKDGGKQRPDNSGP